MLTFLLSRPRRVFALLAALCVALLAFAVLYLQNTVGLEPCPMCIVQRDAFMVLALCCLLAAAARRHGWRLAWGAIAVLTAGFGAFTAARQSWLQWNPPEFATCGRDLYGMIESFPLSRAIPMIFKGSGDCSSVDWTLLGGSIANWSFVAFVGIGLAVLLILVAGSRSTSAR